MYEKNIHFQKWSKFPHFSKRSENYLHLITYLGTFNISGHIRDYLRRIGEFLRNAKVDFKLLTPLNKGVCLKLTHTHTHTHTRTHTHTHTHAHTHTHTHTHTHAHTHTSGHTWLLLFHTTLDWVGVYWLSSSMYWVCCRPVMTDGLTAHARNLWAFICIFLNLYFTSTYVVNKRVLSVSGSPNMALKGPRHIFSFIIFEIFVANDKIFALEPY